MEIMNPSLRFETINQFYGKWFEGTRLLEAQTNETIYFISSLMETQIALRDEKII